MKAGLKGWYSAMGRVLAMGACLSVAEAGAS